MKSELKKRVLLELIEERYKKRKSSKAERVRIDTNDFGYKNDSYGVPKSIDISEVMEMVLELEKETRGRVSLISNVALNDCPSPDKKNKDYFYFANNKVKKYPDYIYLEFNPKASLVSQNQTAQTAIFTLNEQDGLCLVDSNKCYSITGERNKILHSLRKEYTKTANLVSGTSYENDEDGFRAQIRGINELFKKKFPEFSARLIQGDQRKGYRFNPDIKVKIQE